LAKTLLKNTHNSDHYRICGNIGLTCLGHHRECDTRDTKPNCVSLPKVAEASILQSCGVLLLQALSQKMAMYKAFKK
jgi:hypothetical protein